jgi:hypothetical protein
MNSAEFESGRLNTSKKPIYNVKTSTGQIFKTCVSKEKFYSVDSNYHIEVVDGKEKRKFLRKFLTWAD